MDGQNEILRRQWLGLHNTEPESPPFSTLLWYELVTFQVEECHLELSRDQDEEAQETALSATLLRQYRGRETSSKWLSSHPTKASWDRFSPCCFLWHSAALPNQSGSRQPLNGTTDLKVMCHCKLLICPPRMQSRQFWKFFGGWRERENRVLGKNWPS